MPKMNTKGIKVEQKGGWIFDDPYRLHRQRTAGQATWNVAAHQARNFNTDLAKRQFVADYEGR